MRLSRYIVLAVVVLVLLGTGVWFLVKRPDRLAGDMAAMVNGRPVPQYLLAEILSFASLNESLTTPGRRQALARMILAGLIEEELALAAAEKAGLTVSSKEVTAWANYYLSGPEKAVPPFDQESQRRLEEVLRRRLLTRNFVEWLTAQDIPSVADWRQFAASWRDRPKPRSYLVRVVMSPDLETARTLLEQEGQSLDTLAEGLKKKGQPVLLSELFWFPEENMEPVLLTQVETISRNLDGFNFPPKSWSESMPLSGYQAVYEFVRFAEGRSALEDLGWAILAFEAAWREKTYQKWLAGEKAQARIQLNSDLDLMVGSLWTDDPTE